MRLNSPNYTAEGSVSSYMYGDLSLDISDLVNDSNHVNRRVAKSESVNEIVYRELTELSMSYLRQAAHLESMENVDAGTSNRIHHLKWIAASAAIVAEEYKS